MLIQPKIRGFICTTAHPAGCQAHVSEQIDYVASQPAFRGPKKVLVIGSSTGYGLASRIAATFGAGADTIGVCFEKPASDNRTATAGWYNSAAFEQAARQAGHVAKTVNGDAFSHAVKGRVIDLIREHVGQVDLVVYSLASPRRVHPDSGETFASSIKPIGQPYTNKTLNFHTGEVSEITVPAATEDEIRQTVAVMGGDDWRRWIDALEEARTLAPGALTVAYSYIGPAITHPIYREGTIGRAKDDLEQAALQLNERLKESGGGAFISVNKALVTQSSSSIPVVPLYISLLYKVMKERGLHEGCAEQMYRLFATQLYAENPIVLDDRNRIRLDDWELRDDVQHEVAALWEAATTENIEQISDLTGYRHEFLRLFGFDMPGVDYAQDVNPDIPLGDD